MSVDFFKPTVCSSWVGAGFHPYRANTVGQGLALNDNQLELLPEGFGDITVGERSGLAKRSIIDFI